MFLYKSHRRTCSYFQTDVKHLINDVFINLTDIIDITSRRPETNSKHLLPPLPRPLTLLSFSLKRQRFKLSENAVNSHMAGLHNIKGEN